MIVLTDGENNRGAIDPRTAAKAAAVFGIKIYSIGVGTEGMAPVPSGVDCSGLRYENRPVRIDEPLPHDVAKTTGGRYFRARDAAALQSRIYEEINQLEREPVRTRSYIPLHRSCSVGRSTSRRLRVVTELFARRSARSAAMSDIVFDYQYLLPLGILLPALAVFVLRHAYRQRRARLERLGTLEVVSRLFPANTLVPPRWRMVRPWLGERARWSGGRWASLGRRAQRRPLSRHRHGARPRCVPLDDGPRRPAESVGAMKQEVRRLRAASPGDRMGVLAFAGRSYPFATDDR